MPIISEKIWLDLKDPQYQYANIAIAYIPNGKLCSIVAHGVYKDVVDRFISLQLNEEETKKIRDALTEVIRSMKNETKNKT